MLNRNNDDDSSGSEYVLLDAEDLEDEVPDEESASENEPLLNQESVQDLVKEESDLLLQETLGGAERKDHVEDRTFHETNEDDHSYETPGIANDEGNKTNELKEETEIQASLNKIDTTEGLERMPADEENVESEAETPESDTGAGFVQEIEESSPGLLQGSNNILEASEANRVKENEIINDGVKLGPDTESISSEKQCDPEQPDPEQPDADETKENEEPVMAKEELGSREYQFGTREEVNGAAAIFGVTGFVIGGPVLGLLSAAASAHIAANKPCKCATFTRRCGGVLGNIRNKQEMKEGEPVREKKPQLWGKITDGLVGVGEWTEQKFEPLRRIKPKNHKYGPKSKEAA